MDTYLRASPKIYLITDHNPLQWLRKQRDPRHTFARWLMELEELPYQILYRPGRNNQLPDLLSRTPNMPLDPDVNDEDKFEDKIYCTLAPGDWMREETSSTQYIGSSDSEAEANRVLEIRTRDGWLRKIGEEQRNDQVMQSAFKQLSQHGRVYSGQLKGASAYLRLKGETIYFDERVVVLETSDLRY